MYTLACPPGMRRDHYQLEDFVIHRDLGTGHVSVVYLVEDRATGVVCALKAYRKKRLTALNRRQVCREIAIHGGLQHENIIELFCAFEDEYCYYLVSARCSVPACDVQAGRPCVVPTAIGVCLGAAPLLMLCTCTSAPAALHHPPHNARPPHDPC